jgi:hypothetical protein
VDAYISEDVGSGVAILDGRGEVMFRESYCMSASIQLSSVGDPPPGVSRDSKANGW